MRSFANNYLKLAIALIFSVFYNLFFWEKFTSVYPLNLENTPFIISVFIVLFTVIYLLLTLIDFKYTFKPVLIFIITISAIAAYLMDNYNYIISNQTISTAFDTHKQEAFDLLTVKFFMSFSLFGLLPIILLLFSKIQYSPWLKKGKHLFIIIAVLLVNLFAFSSNYSHFFRKNKIIRYYTNPITPIYAITKFIKKEFIYKKSKILNPVGVDATHTSQEKKKLVFLVIGETARAQNFSLGNYSRNTNPLLKQRDQLYYFNNTYSCGTETAISLPCMFSHLNRKKFKKSTARNYENLLDIAKRAGYRVSWRDNDAGCKKICKRIEYINFNNASVEPFCKNKECHDEVLLHKLQDYIDESNTDTLVVIHMQGNHGPAYYKRYPKPFEKFVPTCKTSAIQDCSDEQIVNTYDNAILYSDHVLNELIKVLEANTAFDSSLVYVSDHGESLGEKGLYLHGMPYVFAPKEQKHVPFLFWHSKNYSFDQKKVLSKINEKLSHDHLFHSVLGLLGIKTEVLNEELNIF